MKKEESLQIQISEYIRIQYPNVLFTSESSGLRLPIGLAVKAKRQRSAHKQPDMIILEPKGGYHGLCLELKTISPYKQNGYLKKDEHLEAQQKTIDLLINKGYYATFTIGFEDTKAVIDNYMHFK